MRVRFPPPPPLRFFMNPFAFRAIPIGVLLAIVLITASIGVAQPPDAHWAERLDSIVEKDMKASPIPGVAVGIVSEGKLVYAKGFGVADEGTKQPITTDTLFHMASVTKPFVATALMQLAESGKLSIDDPVVKYLPYFKLKDKQYKDITIRQMLTHTSGMPDVDDYEWDKPQYDDGALARYVKSLGGKKLLWQPGSHFSYSNMAYEVLSDVIAKVSNKTFEDYVEENILRPAGMMSSTLLIERADNQRLASGYTVTKSGKLANIKAYPYNRPHNASSDLMSSVNDMARWAIVNLDHGDASGRVILQQKTYDELWRPTSEIEICETLSKCKKTGSHVGISWFLHTRNDHLIVYHDGGDDGFRTRLVLVPDRKVAFIFLCNSDTAGEGLMKDLYSSVMDAVVGPVKTN
jgi:CubicO group peptidase (beta-lactamase class C family)